MEYTGKLKKYWGLVALLLFLVMLAVFLRGPHISNALKKLILPELEMASGKKVIAGKIYINIFPLFVEAKDLKAFDENGSRILTSKRVKAYLDISGIFSRSLTIRRLVLREPDLDASDEQIEVIRKNIMDYLSKPRKDAIKVRVLAVELRQCSAVLTSQKQKTSVEIENLGGEAILNDSPRVFADAKTVTVKREGLPELSGPVSSRFSIKGDAISIQQFTVGIKGSQADAGGEISEKEVKLKTSATVLVSSFKEIFGLQKNGDGTIKIGGSVQYTGGRTLLDLSLSGNMYLETLMEFLKVHERLEGLVEFKGEVKGPLNDIRGRASAVMTNGNLYHVEIERLACNIVYENGKMSFLDGDGRLYHGRAKASASIALPVVNHFTLDIDFVEADSKPLFKLIGWDPGIPQGKVKGNLHHAGHYFNPKGNFEYFSTETGKDILGKVKTMTGRYDLESDILSLSDLKIKTEKSDADAYGKVDIKNQTLNLPVVMRTTDLHEVTSPYYEPLKGDGEFRGTVTGTFKDPVISGRASISRATIEAYPAETIAADLIYRKNLLQVKDLLASNSGGSAAVRGNIAFREAKELFDIAKPTWGLRAELKNIDSEKFVKIFFPRYKGTGIFSAVANLEGTGKIPEVKADVSLYKATVFDFPVQSASFNFRYAAARLDFTKATVKRDDSEAHGELTIFPDETFAYKAWSDRVKLSDLIRRPLQGEVIASATSEGRGSFDNPYITFDAKMAEGMLRGKPVGKGFITGVLKDREYSGRARLLNDRIVINVKGRTDGIMPWDASAEFQSGRYDFLITSWMKDIPEDLILNLSGTVSLHGTQNHVAGSASIRNLVLSMYGYSFTNEADILLDLKDRELSLGRISLRSGSTLFRAGGSITFGKSYNLSMEGSSALAPFKSFSARLGALKGDASFVLSIAGDWEAPKINGGISLSNGAIGLKEYPAYRITDLNGYLYLDNDRVVLKDLKGKLGGGDIDLSGILYLKKFEFSRFYVEAKMNNITSSVSPDFSLNFGGNLLYKGTPLSQTLSGNIDINRAKYKERIEWKSWLLQTKKAEKFRADIAAYEKAGLNIKITGKENISIDNNVARASVLADMVLRGTIARPSLFGRLETKDGTVYFRNNEFRILNASADFADPNRFNPVITISAETSVKGYRIKMNLEGQLDHFNVSLSSDPPLKEMDVLALLAVGQTGGVKGIEAGIGAGEATSFVTGKMQDVIEERLRSITGLDRFQIDPYVSKTTGTVEPRVTVSKRMLGDKVYVTYASGLGNKEEQILKLEYMVNKNVSLIGIRDERGITGGDVRFRFEFK